MLEVVSRLGFDGGEEVGVWLMLYEVDVDEVNGVNGGEADCHTEAIDAHGECE